MDIVKVGIDLHILTELIVLQDKMRRNALEFKRQWEIITSVRERTDLLVLGQKDAKNKELPILRDKIFRAMKVCNTKMIVMDDAMSRQAALLTHLVSEVADGERRAEKG